MTTKQSKGKAMRLGQSDAIVNQVIGLFPKVISPKAHARFDAFVFPVMVGLAGWMAMRSPRAAALMALSAGTEGGISLITNYPPAIIPLISFEEHIRIGVKFAPFGLASSLLVPGIPKRERIILSLLPFVPFLLNSLSKPAEKRA